MKNIMVAVRRLLIVLVIVGIAALIVMNYSVVFSKTVSGEVLEIERVTQPTAILGSSVNASSMYSFAIAIKQASGEILTASTEDRQWAIVKKGACVEAKFYPYPPWNLEKADTYFNARLTRLKECKPGSPGETAPQTAAAAIPHGAPAAPTPVQSGEAPKSGNDESSEKK